MRKFTRYIVILMAASSLSACQTVQNDGGTNNQNVNEALDRAAVSAGMKRAESRSLLDAEQAYKKNSSNPMNALSYARALRQSEYFSRAATILKPFADKKDGDSKLKTEMSSVQLELGHFGRAEKYAQNAVLQAPEDYLAFRNLGIALEAKGQHPQAERAFRKSLEFWQGDPSPIMNNLALNLATQGFVEEALDILEKAKNLAPNNMTIERNLRIVRTLNER